MKIDWKRLPPLDGRRIVWEGNTSGQIRFKIVQRRMSGRVLTTLFTLPHGPLRSCMDVDEAKTIAEFLTK